MFDSIRLHPAFRTLRISVMKVAIVGGIYGKGARFRQSMQMTPETILENGLRARGCQVHTASHYQQIRAGEFDIVHVHHLGLGALRAASDRADAAFVFTSHDPRAVMGLEPRYSRRWASQWIMSRADALVALSQAEAAFQRRTYRLSGAIHDVIPNGIDAGNYRYGRRNSAGKDRPWQLLFVGQLNELKKVDLLLRALRVLRQPAELHLVYHCGTLELPLRQLAATLNLSDRVHFLGAKPPQELSALYQEADVFVLPSVAEALPSVVSEAMFCGTPIVATDVGGIREQLNGYGVVVAAGQVSALAKGIENVLEHYPRFADQSEAMNRDARQRFSTETMAERHLELYAKLMDRRRPRRRHRFFRLPANAMVKAGVTLLCATK